MNWSLLRKAIVLPGTVMVFIPVTILSLASDPKIPSPETSGDRVSLWLGAGAIIAGMALCLFTVRLFLTFGEGTPAPWEPPRRLVLRGPYQHVRNPMMTGVLAVLLGESLVFRSFPLFIWFLAFLLFNLLYIPLVEEKGLEHRFGEDYDVYKRNVPRWIPKLGGRKKDSGM